MMALLHLLIIGVCFATGYVVALYSLVVYVDPDDLETLLSSATRSRRRLLHRLSGDPRSFRQIAVVYKSFVLVVVSAVTLEALGNAVAGWPMAAPYAQAVGLGIVWLAYIFMLEYLPRRSSRKAFSPQMARNLWIVTVVYTIFLPVINVYRKAARRKLSDDPIAEEDKEEIVERAIETLAEDAGISETIVEENEKEMIGQIFQLDQTLVREIMVPRVDIVGIEKSMGLDEIRQLVLRDGHSRYPVYDGTIDKLAGLIYVKDLFSNLPASGEEFTTSAYLRKPFFIPGTKVIGELLSEFKQRRQHMAVVVDEYGGVAGLVTLEDIIEEIFGEIQDEHDREPAELTELNNGVLLVNAGYPLDKLQHRLQTDHPLDENDTVGGLIYDLVGSVPREGQQIAWHDIYFQIEKIEGQRIVSVRVHT